MHSITEAKTEDAELLAEIGRTSWIEAHGSSAESEHIQFYVSQKYTKEVILEQIKSPSNKYYIVYWNGKPAGYSNLIINAKDSNVDLPDVAELDRLYLLSEFYNLKLGWELLNFNIKLAKENAQNGLWLYVWKGNERALSFYHKAGFEIVGSHDFKISETHSNPNHLMLLRF